VDERPHTVLAWLAAIVIGEIALFEWTYQRVSVDPTPQRETRTPEAVIAAAAHQLDPGPAS
jgi:hypothetical protein